MCLAIPGKIKYINKKTKQATVLFDGVEMKIDISLVDAKVGNYVMVHAGFAIGKLNKKETLEILNLLKLQK